MTELWREPSFHSNARSLPCLLAIFSKKSTCKSFGCDFHVHVNNIAFHRLGCHTACRSKVKVKSQWPGPLKWRSKGPCRIFFRFAQREYTVGYCPHHLQDVISEVAENVHGASNRTIVGWMQWKDDVMWHGALRILCFTIRRGFAPIFLMSVMSGNVYDSLWLAWGHRLRSGMCLCWRSENRFLVVCILVQKDRARECLGGDHGLKGGNVPCYACRGFLKWTDWHDAAGIPMSHHHILGHTLFRSKCNESEISTIFWTFLFPQHVSTKRNPALLL